MRLRFIRVIFYLPKSGLLQPPSGLMALGATLGYRHVTPSGLGLNLPIPLSLRPSISPPPQPHSHTRIKHQTSRITHLSRLSPNPTPTPESQFENRNSQFANPIILQPLRGSIAFSPITDYRTGTSTRFFPLWRYSFDRLRSHLQKNSSSLL